MKLSEFETLLTEQARNNSELPILREEVLNDTGDGSMVCIITGGKRGEKKTLAMAGVMVDALNRAVSRGRERHDGCGSASAAD